MKAGLGTYAFRYAISKGALPGRKALDLTGFLEFCNKHDVKVVQICENIPLHKLTDRELGDAYDLTKKYSIEPEIGTAGYSSDHLGAYIRIAAGFNSHVLRTVLNAGKDQTGEIRSELLKIIPQLEKTGLTLAIENHFDLTPEELIRLIEEINHPSVMICIDPLNSITRLRGINETVMMLSRHIASAHIKDVRIARKGTGFMISGCRLGEGIAEAENYITWVYRANPRCNIFLEQWMDPLESEEATLAEEEKWILHGLNFLREKIKGLASSELNYQL